MMKTCGVLVCAAVCIVVSSDDSRAQKRSAAVEAYAAAARERKERRAKQRQELEDATGFTVKAALDARFDDAAYWRDFYRDPASHEFEWYDLTLDAFQAEFSARVPFESRLLHAGCGTSSLPEGLWRQGWREAIHCDVDPEAIAVLHGRYSETLPRLAAQLEVCDLTQLARHTDGSFDAVLEKGTFDALLSGGWQPRGGSAEEASVAERALLEMLRVLRPMGVLISVSIYGPENRMGFLNSVGAGWQGEVLTRLTNHGKQDIFVYAISKGHAAEPTPSSDEL